MATPSKGLGRGLESLLGQRPRSAERGAPGSIAIASIRPGPSQPRASMRREQLEELAASIKVNGVIQPIVVRPIGDTVEYEIVAGERRWQAAKLAGLLEIPAVVRELTDQAALAVALIENIQREDLTPAEEARSLQRLISEFSLTHAQVAQAVGRSRAAVSNLLRLLDLPAAVMQLIESRTLGMGHARALLSLESDAERVRIAAWVAEKGLSVRATEDLVRRAMQPNRRGAPRSADLAVVSDLLATSDLQVRLHQLPTGAGRLVVDFKDPALGDQIVAAIKAIWSPPS